MPILLPYLDCAATRSSPSDAASPDGGTETILVVDDEASIAEVIGNILARAGYTMLVANSAEEALRLADDERAIDLLLTDIRMPQMNGRELAERLTASRPALKVVYMSGCAADPRRFTSTVDRWSEFMAKPFEPATIRRRVRDMLDRSPQSS
ncbi:MAG: response regulator [Gemmatimonadaceae bacterium]